MFKAVEGKAAVKYNRATPACTMPRGKRKSEVTTAAAAAKRTKDETTDELAARRDLVQSTGVRRSHRKPTAQAGGADEEPMAGERQHEQAVRTAAAKTSAKTSAGKRVKGTNKVADSDDHVADGAAAEEQVPKRTAKSRRSRTKGNNDKGDEHADSAKAEPTAKKAAAKPPCPPVPTSGYWLMKNEPDELSMESLQEKPNQTAYWDGVRNYQARNFIRQMKIGDQIMFYYSSCKVPGIAGIAKVVKEAYPDHTAWDPSSNYYDPKSTPDKPVWDMVDVQAVSHLPRFLTLEELRKHSAEGGMLHGMLLFTRFRLSVMPLLKEHWDALVQLAEAKPEAQSDSKGK